MNGKRWILLIEDDNKLRTTVQDYLEMNGFGVLSCADGRSALQTFSEKNDIINLILLDGLLPDIDGFEVLKRIREQSDIPVIIVSARESEISQLMGLRNGADNYITKPFLLSVMKEKINALLRRADGVQMKSKHRIDKGRLSILLDERKIILDGQLLETTPREYDMLLFFCKNERIVFNRNQILDNIWGVDYFGDFRTVDTIVKQLRKKLGSCSSYIESIYGVGYRFDSGVD